MFRKKRFTRQEEHEMGPGIRSGKEESVMRCHRCKGIMIFEKFYGDCEHFFGWRCVVCGEIIDQVILENRLGNVQ